MIIGQPGSGKSTLARRLGEALNLPVVHIDLIHWKSGWIERDGKEKDKLCAAVHQRDRWIFEGGRSSTWLERLDRADTLIFLDFPFLTRVWRILKRRVKYHGTSRPDLPEGCPENISWEFVHFVWTTRRKGRQKMIRFFDTVPGDKESYRLQSRSEVEAFVRKLSSA